jgi:hypothetical protein
MQDLLDDSSGKFEKLAEQLGGDYMQAGSWCQVKLKKPF